MCTNFWNDTSKSYLIKSLLVGICLRVLKQKVNFAVGLTCSKQAYQVKNENQLDATYYFIVLLIGLTCFGHYYAHHQELETIMLITTLVVSFLVCCRLEVRCG